MNLTMKLKPCKPKFDSQFPLGPIAARYAVQDLFLGRAIENRQPYF